MLVDLYPEEVASLANYDADGRRISIFASSENGIGALRAIAESMGLDVLYEGPIETGEERCAHFALGDAVLLNVESDGGATLDVLLDRLDAIALADDLPVLVNLSPECLDSVAARLNAPSITLMCQATPVDWMASLALIGTGRPTVLHDVALDDALRLQRLAEDVQRIARTLADLAGPGANDAMIGFRAGTTPFTPPPTSITAADVRAIIRLRRLRDRYFRSDLFADPAWDMLLDLMAARLERMRVAVSSLCIAAAVPPTTALRWIKTMCDNGLFVRVADPEDGRRVFIELSDGAASAMTAYLGAAKATGGLAV